ncbi:hypothetical protein K458DRAFT_86027 [Lentithecium fluviatile CBS 122367]|uniref:Uncharacterized protein n=1 Tax=Lentithecium fluviatile CBS 122367 TaxID=1168545 RepID=A0A6G1IS74_9PLEO|nr:hypothetical protein K458DRAFT_86027 [Lentithecium fluviatile CBS 122367]
MSSSAQERRGRAGALGGEAVEKAHRQREVHRARAAGWALRETKPSAACFRPLQWLPRRLYGSPVRPAMHALTARTLCPSASLSKGDYDYGVRMHAICNSPGAHVLSRTPHLASRSSPSSKGGHGESLHDPNIEQVFLKLGISICWEIGRLTVENAVGSLGTL